MVGDGLLAINGVDIDDKSPDEVARLLDSADQRPTAVLTVCRRVIAAATTTTTDRTGKTQIPLR